MGIVIRGKTKCLHCGLLIEENDEITGIPSFLPPENRLSKYNDATLHKKCFEKLADREAIERAMALHQEIWKSRPSSLKSREEIEAWGKKAFEKMKEV